MDLLPVIGGVAGTIVGVSYATYFRRKAKSPEAARPMKDRVILTHHWLVKPAAALCLIVFGGLFAIAALVPDDGLGHLELRPHKGPSETILSIRVWFCG